MGGILPSAEGGLVGLDRYVEPEDMGDGVEWCIPCVVKCGFTGAGGQTKAQGKNPKPRWTGCKAPTMPAKGFHFSLYVMSWCFEQH